MLFADLHRLSDDITVLNEARSRSLYLAAKFTNHIPGTIVEAGLWEGGSAIVLLGASNMNRKMRLFDSFCGLPVPADNDKVDSEFVGIAENDFFGSKDVVIDNIVSTIGSEYINRIVFHSGWFEDTMNNDTVNQEEKFSLVHIDCDLYESTKTAINFCYPKVASGGLLLVDDYEYHNTPGVKLAINEYFGGIDELDHWFQDIQLTIRIP